MQPLTLNRTTLPAFTGLPLSVALDLLTRHGVQPMDFGPGRGRGLHWSTEAVKLALHNEHMAAQQTTPKKDAKPRRIWDKSPVSGKTFNQLFSEIMQGREPSLQ